MTDNCNDDSKGAETAPSAEYIQAVSRFFDTDPSDLLLEMGYYERDMNEYPQNDVMTAQE